MTAEIAILNKEAVALAADSAVTSTLIGGQKIFTSADKIFALSDLSPVGIMFYNNATFMGVPWDTILKTFRKQLPQQGYDRLDDYVSAFIEFLENNNALITGDMQREFLGNIALGYFTGMINEIEKVVSETIEERGPIDSKTVENIVLKVMNDHADKWAKTKVAVKGSYNKTTCKKIVTKNKEVIDGAIDVAFGNLPISKGRNRLFEIMEGLLYVGTNEQINAGVVIAGFGEREAFPTMKHMVFDGLFENRLKYVTLNTTSIGADAEASIAPFAQTEMVARFMEGIDPFYREIEEGYLSELPRRFAEHFVRRLRKYNKAEKDKMRERLVADYTKVIDNFQENMLKIGREEFVDPITHVVSVLPKSDLAMLAESLVSLTVVKRKFSPESETVAEPIDVALISKGDGFIWIRRKHYFDPQLNPRFFAKRYKE